MLNCFLAMLLFQVFMKSMILPLLRDWAYVTITKTYFDIMIKNSSQVFIVRIMKQGRVYIDHHVRG